jgi:hypothetical protein
MLKINELRIGNFVEIDNEEFTEISNLDLGGKSFFLINDVKINKETLRCQSTHRVMFSPIKISEYWLKGFDFVPTYSNIPNLYRISLDSQKQLRHDEIDGVSVETKHSGFRYVLPHIKYVHELQNLYFALSGNELGLSLS